MRATSTSRHVAYKTVVSNESHSLDADVQPDKGGQGDGFRPHELLEAALAACMAQSARMLADREGLPLEEVETTVELERTSEETAFRIDIELSGKLTDQQRAHILEAMYNCPVRKTLSKELVFQVDSSS